MNNLGPIIVVEDDPDDQDFLREVFLRLKYPNEIIFFGEGNTAFDYLVSLSHNPFIIISDINLPFLSGFELRERINNNDRLRLKCTPFVFLTTSNSEKDVALAFTFQIQGYFVKPHLFNELELMISKILEYWASSLSPSITPRLPRVS
ncbi:MAG: response regulator [Ferruginibacter sp.]